MPRRRRSTGMPCPLPPVHRVAPSPWGSFRRRGSKGPYCRRRGESFKARDDPGGVGRLTGATPLLCSEDAACAKAGSKRLLFTHPVSVGVLSRDPAGPKTRAGHGAPITRGTPEGDGKTPKPTRGEG